MGLIKLCFYVGVVVLLALGTLAFLDILHPYSETLIEIPARIIRW